jgi:hypothetical protein
MTWDQREAAALSAAIRSHRLATDTPAPERIYHLKSGAFSSSLAEITDFRVRNAVRRWLLVAIHRAFRETERARSLRQSREASICEARLTGLRNFALVLGPVEPETLLLRPEWSVH